MAMSPSFEQRQELTYIGKREVMPMKDFEQRIPALIQEVVSSLDEHHIEPSGHTFTRYHVIDMPDRMDIEVAFPVAYLPEVEDGLSSGSLPAGLYAELTFTGVENGISANRTLVEWISEQGREPDSHTTDKGEAFAGRIETLLTDPESEPDQANWETRVAIKVRY